MKPKSVSELLRFNGAVKREPAIEAWLSTRPLELASIAQVWFGKIRECGADVRELMHDGCPTACVEDAGFAYVNAFRSHVNVGFFRGASLPDPAHLLEGNGKYMRHVKLRPGVPVDASALQALIIAAHSDIVARLAHVER